MNTHHCAHGPSHQLSPSDLSQVDQPGNWPLSSSSHPKLHTATTLLRFPGSNQESPSLTPLSGVSELGWNVGGLGQGQHLLTPAEFPVANFHSTLPPFPSQNTGRFLDIAPEHLGGEDDKDYNNSSNSGESDSELDAQISNDEVCKI
jgi:hypothetical protein